MKYSVNIKSCKAVWLSLPAVNIWLRVQHTEGFLKRESHWSTCLFLLQEKENHHDTDQ